MVGSASECVKIGYLTVEKGKVRIALIKRDKTGNERL